MLNAEKRYERRDKILKNKIKVPSAKCQVPNAKYKKMLLVFNNEQKILETND
jgi:hypothetical protein